MTKITLSWKRGEKGSPAFHVIYISLNSKKKLVYITTPHHHLLLHSQHQQFDHHLLKHFLHFLRTESVVRLAVEPVFGHQNIADCLTHQVLLSVLLFSVLSPLYYHPQEPALIHL